jgi:Ni,Fe-hydrogenase III large subunit
MADPAPEMTKVFLPVMKKDAENIPPPTPGPSDKVVIDPITRIEGHLRIEVQIENGYVTDAWSAGMMFRGIELIMPGRDPRDAWVFTQRICGV